MTTTTRSVDHGTFTVERTYPVPRERAFAAWASTAAKAPWFADDTDFFARPATLDVDFRVGGLERLEGTLANGRSFVFGAVYQDIVDDERIICSYEVLVDDRRMSVSLMTVEFADAADGTRLTMTEQGAFLDGLDSNEQRIEGATDMLDKLGEHLRSVT